MRLWCKGLAFGLLVLTSAVHADCMQNLQQEDYMGSVKACFPELLNKKSPFRFGEASPFGTVQAPSKEALLAKQLAEKGDPNFQLFWSFVLVSHGEKMSMDHEKYTLDELRALRAGLNKQIQEWRIKAAEAGHQMAISMLVMPVYTKQELPQPDFLPTAEEKALALRFLPKLDSSMHKLPADLQQKIQQVKTKEDKLAEEQNQLLNAAKLSEQELIQLASDLKDRSSYSGRVRSNWGEIKEVYQLLIDNYQNTDAAVSLANETSKRAVKLKWMQWAAERKHKVAMSWYGAYLVCNQQTTEGMAYLRQAQKAGDSDAPLLLDEIKDLGYTTNCDDGWIY
jgi:uncharacterized coiled-coil DUF342 family protein